MHLRLAQVAPPAGHAARLQLLVDVPEPVARLRLEDVDQAGVPEIEIVGEGLAVLAGASTPCCAASFQRFEVVRMKGSVISTS
jgi:hypothetical protein